VVAHRWIGIGLALYVVLLSLTGALLVWHRELDRALNPVLLATQAPAAQHVDLERMWQAGRAVLQPTGACSLYWPTRGMDTYGLSCEARRADGTRTFLTAYLDPATTAVRGTREWSMAVSREHLTSTIYALHSDLLLGDSGEMAVGIGGAVLCGTLLAGAILWLPASWRALREALRIRRGAPLFRTLFDWHRVMGAYPFLVLLVLAASGVYLVFPQAIRGGLGVATEQPRLPRASAAGPGARASVDSLAMAGQAVFPDGVISAIDLPETLTVPATVHVLLPGTGREVFGTSTVHVDQATARILASDDVRLRPPVALALEWQLPLHTGEALGVPGRIVATAAALALSGLAISGVWMWLLRRRRD